MHFRNRFSSRERVTAPEGGQVRVKQSMKDACDINRILARYVRSGQIDHLAKYGGSYDIATAGSFHEAMNMVLRVQAMFADLPSAVRAKFDGKPEEFLAFVQDEKNLSEMRELGLAKPAGPVPVEPLAARLAELEVDAKARLELARRAYVPPGRRDTVDS